MARTKRRTCGWVVAAVVNMLALSCSKAQSADTAALLGGVVDRTQGAVPGAQIIVKDERTGWTRPVNLGLRYERQTFTDAGTGAFKGTTACRHSSSELRESAPKDKDHPCMSPKEPNP